MTFLVTKLNIRLENYYWSKRKCGVFSFFFFSHSVNMQNSVNNSSETSIGSS